MKEKIDPWKIILLTCLACLFLILILRSFKPNKSVKEEILPEFTPYSGEFELQINPITTLDGMSIEEIAVFRTDKVEEYSFLDIFPYSYNPLEKRHKEIYGSITSGAGWLESAQFYICNPYLLVILTCANHVTPLVRRCGNPNIKYSNGVIEETYRGENARNWFDELYSYNDYPGIVRLWMVNAYDAYLFYANVDKERTENIDFNWSTSSGHIVNSIHRGRSLFHFGHHGVNNLSSADSMARIKILNKYDYTCIYVKLWRNMPLDKNEEADFAYIIRLIP